MKKRGLEILAAVGVVALIAGFVYLVLSLIMTTPPEVGTVTVTCAGESVTPVQNEIYRTVNKEKKEGRRLVPQEVIADAPSLIYDDDITVSYDGKSENGSFFFTIYDESADIYEPKKAFFTPLAEKGTYMVCIETYWGVEKENIGMEYYFKLVVE